MSETVCYGLTSPQLSIWNTEMTYPGTTISNVAGTLRIKDNINFEIFEKALQLLIQNNDGMRIRIRLDNNGNPVQYVSDYKEEKIEFIDFSVHEDPLKALYKWDRKMTSTPFELIEQQLFRLYMIKISDNDGGFYINLHHIINDAWSIALIGSEIIRYYYLLLKGSVVDEKRPSYIDYIKKEEQYLNSERYKKDQEYWHKVFAYKPEITILKSNKNNTFSTKSKRKTFILPAKFTKKLNDYCKENKVSKYQIFVAGLAGYIYRITSQKDIIIGTPILNRTTANEKKTVGMFINTVPLRLSLDENISFKDFSQKISNDILLGLKHQRYPYDQLLKEVRQKHGIKDNLYDIILSYQNSKFDISEVEYQSRWHFNGHQSNSLTIHINDRDDGGDLIIDYDYHENLYYDKEIEFTHRHFLSLLWHALDSPMKPINRLEMISESEKKRILYDFNNTRADYDKNITMHRLFEKQVEKTPDRIALQFEDKSMTYNELNQKANQLARILADYGVKPDMPVGIMAYRSFEMIIGILAIVKAGGAYVPIDPKNPIDRIEYLVNDSGVKIILTSFKSDLDIDGVNIFYINDLLQKGGSVENLPDTSNSRNLLYIIYTSGSTGQPKGVMLEHYSVVNRINWMQKAYPIGQNDTLIQKTPYTFDVSVWELFWWFFAGSKLAILIPEGEKDPEKLLSAIMKYNVTTIHFVPSMLKAFIDYLNAKSRWNDLEPLNTVFCSGEALPVDVVQEFMKKRQKDIMLVNLYGPTEAAVDVTYYTCNDKGNKTIPIGKPIDNIQLYILDKYLNLQPIGTVGELYISGDGLARGYINKPELTKKSFIPNPYQPGKLMYKTGDLARWYPQGEIEYIGRADHQIKIRGHRVELNEIRLQIMKEKSVKDALVTCKEKNGAKHIYAYIIFNGQGNINEIKNNLRRVFPAYMVPAFFVELKEFPLLTNGKVDMKRLPEPQETVEECIPPRDRLEESLMMIWKEVLGKDVKSVKSNFFDLGGDSLTAIQLITKFENMTIEDIYQNPTIELLANRIRSNNCVQDRILIKYNPIEPVGKSAIVCFPYGGGSSVIYEDLFKEISKINQSFSLLSVNLPGHSYSGNSQQKFINIYEAADNITKELTAWNVKETILYGHCVGAALTLLTARKLFSAGIDVKAVCLGGVLPPRFVKYYGNYFYPWALFSDKFILNYLKKIGFTSENLSDEVLPYILNAFRYDVKNFYQYFYKVNKDKDSVIHISAPLYLIVGDKDPLTRHYQKRYKEWYKYADTVKVKVIGDANHYFNKTHASDLAGFLMDIQEDCKNAAI